MKIDRKDYEKTLPILAKKIEELENKIKELEKQVNEPKEK